VPESVFGGSHAVEHSLHDGLNCRSAKSGNSRLGKPVVYGFYNLLLPLRADAFWDSSFMHMSDQLRDPRQPKFVQPPSRVRDRRRRRMGLPAFVLVRLRQGAPLFPLKGLKGDDASYLELNA
jgi:hypothetical protein